MPARVPITAVFPAYDRVKESLRTIAAIKACDPAPDQIIVHVDGGSPLVMESIRRSHPDVEVIHSEKLVGPGGARNALVRAARHELVANFDDDSQPDHSDYFARVMQVAGLFPEAAVLSAANLPEEKTTPGFMRIGIFSGCGCVYRKSWFETTSGYVPLRVAYCMEEVDLSLRLHAVGGIIVHDPVLQVAHLKELPLSVSVEGNACVLSNIALMPMLRYPWFMLPLSLWHVFNRVQQMARQGLWRSLARGLLKIPFAVHRNWKFREAVSFDDLLTWNRLRRNPELLVATATATAPVT